MTRIATQILFITCAAFAMLGTSIQQANAQQKVVVVPIIGNDSELKPIKPSDLIDSRRAFTNSVDRLTLGTVTSERGFVLTSLVVAPEVYPVNRAVIALRFCTIFTSGSTNCSHSWAVPNDDVTKIDWGIGEIFTRNGQHYIDIVDRGGLASNNATQQIVVQASGYFFDK